jgi:hypothetical protein
MAPSDTARAAPADAGSDPRKASCLAADDFQRARTNRHLQGPRYDRGAIEGHARLLHSCGAACRGFILLTPIWEGEPPRPQRFKIGNIAAMVNAVMAFDGVPGVNLYAQYGTMHRDLSPGKKGGERDVEAVFAAVADIDNDKTSQLGIPIEPSYVVESSPGNFQHIYIFPKPLAFSEAKPVLCALHAAVGGDSAQKDCSHVWRIPGTLNRPTKSKIARGRSPKPAPVLVASPWEGLLVDPAEILALAPPPKARQPTSSLSRAATSTDETRLRSALAAIPADDRDVWLRVGMALHSQGMRSAWDLWSQQSEKFDLVDQDRTWERFKPGDVKIGTLFYLARAYGWR